MQQNRFLLSHHKKQEIDNNLPKAIQLMEQKEVYLL